MKYYYMAFIPEEKGGYTIFAPDFKELASQGKDLPECMDMAMDALQLLTEDYAKHNEPLPEPSDLKEAQEKILALLKELDVGIPENIIYQLVPAPIGDMKPVRISATLPRWTLDVIDMKAKASGMTRSGFLAKAALAYE